MNMMFHVHFFHFLSHRNEKQEKYFIHCSSQKQRKKLNLKPRFSGVQAYLDNLSSEASTITEQIHVVRGLF